MVFAYLLAVVSLGTADGPVTLREVSPTSATHVVVEMSAEGGAQAGRCPGTARPEAGAGEGGVAVRLSGASPARRRPPEPRRSSRESGRRGDQQPGEALGQRTSAGGLDARGRAAVMGSSRLTAREVRSPAPSWTWWRPPAIPWCWSAFCRLGRSRRGRPGKFPPRRPAPFAITRPWPPTRCEGSSNRSTTTGPRSTSPATSRERPEEGKARRRSMARWTFDRRANLVTGMTLQRAEVRKPGQVEAGLDLKGDAHRRAHPPADVPAELTDAALEGLDLNAPAGLKLLELKGTGGRYALLHDRDWHLFWDDARRTVLKRLDRGELGRAGQFRGRSRGGVPVGIRTPRSSEKMSRRPSATASSPFWGPGRSTATTAVTPTSWSFRDARGDHDILWYYYLLAGPEGNQLLVTFTMNGTDKARFGDEDARLLGSLRWTPAAKERAAAR